MIWNGSERAKLSLADPILSSLLMVILLLSGCAGRPVAIYDDDTRLAIRLDADVDGNGLIESRTYFATGRPLRIEVDIDGDSRVDRWEYYGVDGALERLGSASQADGREDTWLLQSGGETRLEISTRRDGVIDRREVQRDGVVRATEQDSNFDGLVDQWVTLESGRIADAIDFEAALAAAVPVPTLPGAVTLAPPFALLLACMHRIAHHLDMSVDRLIWLYDIHLLSTTMTEPEWRSFTTLAAAARVRTVCLDGLDKAGEALGTLIPPRVRAALVVPPGSEPSARFLQPMRELDVRLSSLRAARPSQRAALVWAWLVPSRTYMIRRYEIRHEWLLPFWYGYRILSRLPRWLARYRGEA